MSAIPTFMPALITPFDGNGELDREAHRHNIEFLSSRGIKGFVIAGSTGEGPYLEPGERSTLVAAARSVSPTTYLLCGINGETVRMASAQIREAADAGADAVLVITPTTLVRNRHTEIEAFYDAVASWSPLPVYLYTVPPVTGYELPLESIARLAGHPAIAGMKDSSGKAERIAELAGDVPDDFTTFVGASRAVTAGIAAGAHGAITASANYCWPLVGEVVANAAAGDAASRNLQERLTRLAAQVEPHGLAATKAAAEMVGLLPGLPRPPLQPLHQSRRQDLLQALAEAGLKPQSA